MTHPTHAELLRYVLEDTETADIPAHVADCRVCAVEIERLRLDAARLRVRTGGTEPTAACLDDDAVAALASGDVSPADRQVLAGHVAACAWCSARVSSVASALGDPFVAHEVVAADAGRTRRPTRLRLLVPLAAAAAAVVIFTTLPPPNGGPPPPHRASSSVAAAPELVAPVGDDAAADTLRWTAVAGADRYRVTLFDGAATLVHEAQTADTFTVLPDSIVLVADRPYLWMVQARVGWDRWSDSPLTEFSVQRGRGR